MLSKLNRIFAFTRGERNALLLIAFFKIVGLVWLYWNFYIQSSESSVPDEDFLEEIIQYENFDENSISESGIEAYEKMSAKNDSDKMNGLKSSTKEIARKTDKENTDTENQKQNASTMPDKKICINKADSIELLDLPGIGEVYASRIVRFRELLGGYYEVGQLKEIYGMRDEHYENMKPHLEVCQDVYRKISINSMDSWQLQRHPYISEDQAEKIIVYIEENGPFEKPEDLVNIENIEAEEAERVIPYLELEQ